tara:strand:- start:639 stop:1448 length:810 start_codon:yes stop_codon:yes gene_type:complete
MAETLTFDNTTEQTSADALTSEEQDSLQVGEQLQEQENQLLAGKYENAQELEKAYIELQKKMGSEDKGEGEEEASTETEETEEPIMEVTPAVEALTTAALEFDKGGEVSPETMAKFSEMDSKELVETYTKMYSKAIEQGYKPDGGTADITDAQVVSIHDSVGGEKAYDNVLNWATENLPEAKMSSFDRIVEAGNAEAIQLAVDGIKSQYDNAQGYEGRMLTGKAPRTSGDVYRSQQEVVAAMNDSRYDNDPAYRQDVIQKLDRSKDLQF